MRGRTAELLFARSVPPQLESRQCCCQLSLTSCCLPPASFPSWAKAGPPPCCGFLQWGERERVQQGERGSVSEVSIFHLAAGLGPLPMEADGRDKSPVHICSLKEKNMDGLCQTLSVQCLLSKFLSCSHIARGAGVSTDPSAFHPGLLPPLVTSVTFLPEGRTVTCSCSQGPWGTEGLCD